MTKHKMMTQRTLRIGGQEWKEQGSSQEGKHEKGAQQEGVGQRVGGADLRES